MLRPASVPNAVGLGNDHRNPSEVRDPIRDAIGAANVNAYTIDAQGYFVSDLWTGPEPGGLMFLRTLAEETGGLAFLNTNDRAGPLARIVEDGSSYYILGYHVPTGRTDARLRTVNVQVCAGR